MARKGDAVELIISGINGRMGRVVLEAVAGETGLSVACGIDRAAHPDGPPRCGDAEIPVHAQAGDCPKADAIIDFSHYTAVPGLLEYAVSSGTPVCVCTTALGGDERACLHAAARSIPVFNSSNMSLGINVMAKMARLAMPAFEAGFNVEIIEKHHNQKKDSPSGTAILLADAISDACETPKEYVFGRHGKDDEVRLSQLGIHAVRGGTIPG